MQVFAEKIKALQIPENIKADLVSFIGEVNNVFGNESICCYVYGPAAKDEFVQNVSGVNLMVVVDNLDVSKIDSIAGKANQYKTKSSILPRFLTKKNVLTGLDVFAIDYFEIQKEGILLAGDDILKDKAIEQKHLVFQLERDTKAMRMKVIQGYWRSVDQVPALRKVLFVNLRQLLKLLRVMLDIKNVQYSGMEQAITKSAEIIKFDPDKLSGLLKTRKEKKELNKNELVLYSRELFNVIALMDDYFDEWNK